MWSSPLTRPLFFSKIFGGLKILLYICMNFKLKSMKKFVLVSMLLLGTLVLFSQEPMKLATDEAKAKIEKLDKEISYHKDEVKRHNKEVSKLSKDKKNLEKVVKSIKKVN